MSGNNDGAAMKRYDKQDFPVSSRFLEPGPIVLVTTALRGKTNIMTMGWHMIMEFEPSLIGCYAAAGGQRGL